MDEHQTHLLTCGTCHQPFDMRDLGQVLYHEQVPHRPVVLPAVREVTVTRVEVAELVQEVLASTKPELAPKPPRDTRPDWEWAHHPNTKRLLWELDVKREAHAAACRETAAARADHGAAVALNKEMAADLERARAQVATLEAEGAELRQAVDKAMARILQLQSDARRGS